MRNQLLSLWDNLRGNYWFIPAMMALFAVALAFIMIEIDLTLAMRATANGDVLRNSTPDGAREILSTVASSMITVAGVVFSLVMVVLSLTSQQYGPLILTNFIRDRINQFVLGTFTGTFIYSLLVLRRVNSTDEATFVPQIATLIGVILAMFSLAVLILFIHHIAVSIQAASIIDRVGDGLNDAVNDLFPAAGQEVYDGTEIDPDALLRGMWGQAAAVENQHGGYLQLVDDEQLLHLATKHDMTIILKHRPGQYVMQGCVLGAIYPPDRTTAALRDDIRETFIIGKRRTPIQDVELLVEQLVEIALRALSPAINDPFTAMMCIDRLGEGLRLLAHREAPSSLRYDKEGRLRLIANPVQFHEVMNVAFNQIRHYGGSDIRVMMHMLETLKTMGENLSADDERRVLHEHADLILTQSRQRVAMGYDLEQLEGMYAEFKAAVPV